MQYLLQAGLIQPDAEVGILETLPQSARRAIVIETCAALSNPAISVPLPTAAHIKWYLEAIGCAFTLPLDDLDALQAATRQYCQWLSEPDKRPAGVSVFGGDDFDEIMLRLMSSLFVPRKADTRAQTTGALQRHIDLCKQALQAMQAFTRRELSEDLKVKTVRIILGLCDSLLSLPSLPFCYLAEELSDSLLTLCWSSLLSFEHMDSKSWQFLQIAFCRWTHRPQVIGHWQSIALGTSEALIHKLYSSDNNHRIAIQYINETFAVQKNAFLAFSWDQIVDLLPKPGRLSAANFCRAVVAMDKVIAALTMCSPETVSLQGQQTPDANSILKLFGEWLFEAITSGPNRDPNDGQEAAESEGRAMAIGILCRVFSQPQGRSPILPSYLERFYASLHHACTMNTNDLFPLVMIIISSEELFAADLAGIRVLIGSIVYGIRRIIPSTDDDLTRMLGKNVRVDFADLRRSCYKILATVFATFNHFADVSLPSLVKSFPASSSSSKSNKFYSDAIRKVFLEEPAPADIVSLKAAVLEPILESVLVERDAGNIQYLLNSLTAFLFDCAESDPEMIGLSLKLIGEQLEQEKWGPEVCPSAFLTVSQLAKLQAVVHQQSREQSKKLVLSLCRFGESLMSAGTTSARSLLPSLIEALASWCLEGNWLDGDHECQSVVLSLLADCASSGFVPIDGAISAHNSRVQEAAEATIERLCLRYAIDRTSNHFPQSVSANLPSDAHLAYLVADQHLSIITPNNGNSATVSAVTPQGQFAFQHHLVSGGLSSSFVAPKQDYQFEALPPVKYSQPMDIFQSTPAYNAIFDSVSASTDKLKQRLQELQQAMALNNIDPSCPQRQCHDAQYKHLILNVCRGKESTAAFAAQALPEKAKCLAATKESAQAIRDTLSAVEELSDRDSLSASLVFVRSGRMSCREIIEEQPLSLDFADFCKSLGLADGHEIAFKDHSVELALRCPSLLPRYSSAYVNKCYEELGLEGRSAVALSTIRDSSVMVLWVEELDDFVSIPGKLMSEAVIYLVVQPLRNMASNGLYRVRIMVTEAESISSCVLVFGPLLDGMIVRRAVLGDLIRATVISASKYLKYATTSQPPPASKRGDQIDASAASQQAQPVSGVSLMENLMILS